ncbi:hypothetical protein MMC06_001309 [Schaereria dolodes]|nr:hypothetical protein [Schaereria dolodes]
MIGDLADFSLAKKTAELTMKEFGQINGLIVNHGIVTPISRVEESEAEVWRKTFDINFFSAVAFAQATLPALRKSKGCILLTSSGSAVSALSGQGAYGASKAALNYLALSLRTEEPEVTSMAIRPGMVDTEMQREIREDLASLMGEDVAAKFINAHKEGKLLKPEQPANVMAKLVLNPPNAFSGRFISWNDEELAAFQNS